ncbi:hypothetical protein B0J18DRAFT_383613 [Chaetomium sp. MPI-SDFR-AT-0129]|nr:hypothetical protein B0J18DRAFT_383613 [Chaetomium sp. MPI-SDFR-AT-0129]
MPKQYTLCGRRIPRLGTRRIPLLLTILGLFALITLLSSTISTGFPSTTKTTQNLRTAAGRHFTATTANHPWLNKLNPFKAPAHPPRLRKSDTDGESVWYADWSWLRMPFSSAVTLDENRALLPPLKERVAVYCYYDGEDESRKKKGDGVLGEAEEAARKDAESELLLAWRRAWWAQGFKPVILGPAEAMNNPLYEELQKVEGIRLELKTDLMRWLAWENMGDGVLASYLVFPMGPHDDPLLAHIRRGEFPKLTRFRDFDDGLFVGSTGDVTAVIKRVMSGQGLAEAKDVITAAEANKESPFVLDDAPKALAYYSMAQVKALYVQVVEDMTVSYSRGLKSLTHLINAHLHTTWQSTFTDGITVAKPLPHHTTHLITPAYELAQRLAHCPESPIPDSCPPNRPTCRVCDDSKPMKVTIPSSYSDASTLYTIGTVPHPYTTSTLGYLRTELSIPWIRRDSPRDAWTTSLMSSLFPDSISTTPRLIRFKEAVASDEASITEATQEKGKGKGDNRSGTKGGASRSLWLPAEQPLPTDLDWHFGFILPAPATYVDQLAPNSKGTITIPALHSQKDGPLPTEADLALEPAILSRARAIVLPNSQKTTKPNPKGKTTTNTATTNPPEPHDLPPLPSKGDILLRNAIEAWNLADTEAWRFARAYLARKSVERAEWEAQEAKYGGGMGMEKGQREARPKTGTKKGTARIWDRWLD